MVRLTTDRGKTLKAEWCSDKMSERELWIKLPPGLRIPDVAADIDGCAVISVADGVKAMRYEGYTRLTNAMLDESGMTLRVEKE